MPGTFPGPDRPLLGPLHDATVTPGRSPPAAQDRSPEINAPISLAFVCLTSIVGAARRNTNLAGLTDSAGVSLGLDVQDSLWLAACLIPTAMIGAVIGADLTHRVPSRSVRMAFLVLMCWAGVQMLGRF